MSVGTLAQELNSIREEILKMGCLLEEQITKSVQALIDKDRHLAGEIIERDNRVDQMELEIEEKCLRLLALKQPMASDLRFIATALRVIVDIERMADHAEDIAQIAIELYEQPYIKPLIDIPRMAGVAQDMAERALRSLIDEDTDLAMSLVPLERQIDNLYDQVFRELLSYMMQDHRNIPQATDLLLVAGHLERIGDHATNLAEMVVYLVEGKRLDINALARRKD